VSAVAGVGFDHLTLYQKLNHINQAISKPNDGVDVMGNSHCAGINYQVAYFGKVTRNEYRWMKV